MSGIYIQLSARIELDHTSAGELEKDIVRDSYREFCLLSQAYSQNGTLTGFEQMTAASPKAHSLHYKVGFAVALYIRGYGGQPPGFNDTLGRPLKGFDNWQFEILTSSTAAAAAHRVAITFQSGMLKLLHHFGEYLVLEQPGTGEYNPAAVITIRLGPGLAITGSGKAEAPGSIL